MSSPTHPQDGIGKYVLVAAVALAIVAFDQVTKRMIVGSMELHETIPIVPGFVDLIYVRNTGAAFSMFAGHSATFRLPFFAAVSLLAGAAILGFVRSTPASQRVVLLACAFVLGGALGNLVDRLRHGEVIDFVLVHWHDWYWPAFNVADSFISIGVVVLLARTLFVREDGAPSGRPDPSPAS